jgi:outer membrane protein assembly factor BamB
LAAVEFSGKKFFQLTSLWCVAMTLLFLAGCAPARTLQVEPQPPEWLTYMNNVEHTGFTAEDTLGRENVSQAGVLWSLNPESSHLQFDSIFSQPLVADGLIYFGSWDGHEYAVNSSGELVWKSFLGRTVDDARCVPLESGVSGTATLETATIAGKPARVLFVAGGDSYVYALDPKTGEHLWATRLGDPPAYYLWSSPVLYNGSVFIGMASFGDCPLVRAFIAKLDAASGEIQGIFYMVPEQCLGGGIWSTPAIDLETGVLYVTVGNADKCGENAPLHNSILALNAEDLAYIDHWQVPREESLVDPGWSTPTLFEDRAGHELIGGGNKNGIYYALDRHDLARGPVWKVEIAESGPCPQCGQGTTAPAAFDGEWLYVAGGKTVIAGRQCGSSVRSLAAGDGSPGWEVCLPPETDPFPSAITGAVTATPELVIVGYGRSVVIIDKQSGDILRKITPEEPENRRHPPPYFWGSASVGDGIIWIGNMAGTLFAIGVGTEE